MSSIRVAYCTGFWCTNIGNGFFSMGVEHVLKKLLGAENVTVVSDYQTYTTGYGKRLYPDKNQLEYIQHLDVDYVVLAGPVLSKYFLLLWEDVLKSLQKRGVGYIILSAGTMKLDEGSREELKNFFKECPPYILSSRETSVYEEFGMYAKNAYDGICFAFFAPDYYAPAPMGTMGDYVVCNFDKIQEPEMWIDGHSNKRFDQQFDFQGETIKVKHTSLLKRTQAKTDRFSDAIIYAQSLLPGVKRPDHIGEFKILRTDHRFHPHYRTKIYRQCNAFCADQPYGYLNLYANSQLTLSDRVHACAVTLAFGHSAMLFVNTNRVGLLDRVGAGDITKEPVKLDMERLTNEKEKMLYWLKETFEKR